MCALVSRNEIATFISNGMVADFLMQNQQSDGAKCIKEIGRVKDLPRSGVSETAVVRQFQKKSNSARHGKEYLVDTH
ncbi:hypothetical protein TNCV_2655401 [Trichonephila clavipes]|nr:hypothetical protein TNCV_2655401 [Trichonephila clavipes]